MAKNTQSISTKKTGTNWSNNYYNSKFGNSAFWMDADIIQSYEKGSTIDNVKLMSYQRAIGNFVRILTKKDDIKVHFHNKDRSYTDGKVVTISSKIDTGDFDTTVGLALHEASHVLLTDFNAIKYYLNKTNIPANKWQFFKNLVNIIEDRRIDYYVMTNAPGYYGYYDALYDTYFRSKDIDNALKSNVWCNETEQDYENHICNFANPNRNLNALKFLRRIWNVINLSNINRLKSTSDVIEVAKEVYDIIQFAVEQEAKSNNNTPQPADVNKDITEKDVEKMLQDIENSNNEDEDVNEGGAGSNGRMDVNVDDDNNEETGGSGGGMDVNGTDSTNGSKQVELSPAQQARLIKALQKQKSFTNGDIKKKGLARRDAEQINNLADQDIQLAELNIGHNNTKISVVVVKGMTDAICSSDIVNSAYQKSYNSRQNADAVEEGWALGTLLGKKLKTREEERALKTTRLPAGRIDKRLIAELGFGNDKVFSQTLISTTKQSTLHLSLDASGSMGGPKWLAALKTATAIAKAASMIGSLRVIIDVRGAAGGQGNRALVWVVYDSKKDSLSVVRNKFKNLYPGGSTPEGLCFDALMKEIVGVAKGKDAYFINISDGEPAFAGYYGETAATHTAQQVKKMRDNNINVLAFFVTGGTLPLTYESSSFSTFKRMYGKDSRHIDLNNFNELAKTLNSLFERNITKE